MKKTTPRPATNITAFLATNLTPKKKAGKQTQPELDLHDEEQVTCECGQVNKPSAGGWSCTTCDKPLSLVDRVFHAYQAAADAQAAFDSLEAQLLEKVGPKYQEHAECGDFTKTLNLSGQETPGLQVNYKDAFKKIPLEKEALLQSKLGEKYDNFFYQKREISLSDTSDETISILLAKLGAEDFKKFFKIEMSVGTKADMDRKQFQLAPELRLAVQQYKPAVKIRKED